MSARVLRKRGVGRRASAASQPGDTKLTPKEPMGTGQARREGAGVPDRRILRERGGMEPERPVGVHGTPQDSEDDTARLGAHPKTGTARKKGGTGTTFLHRNPHVV